MTRPIYPDTIVALVTETIHGVTITDSYRWLENGESAAELWGFFAWELGL